MKKIFTLFTFFAGLLLSSSISHAQTAEVSVDNFTGRALVSIPLGVIKSGDISMPIGLAHNGGGVKVKDIESSAGIGWNLMAGGEIRREVKGLPDDQKVDNAGNARTGWLYNNNGNIISNFSISNDVNPDCNKGANDLAFLENSFSNLSDTEPDIFYVTAPGLNCQLVIDKDHNFRSIPYMDLQVNYEATATNPTFVDNGRIISITIKSAQGYTYVFNTIEKGSRRTVTSLDPNAIPFFKREYQQFKNGIDYVFAWKLTQIRDIKNNQIDLSYLDALTQSTDSRINLTIGTDTTRVTPYFVKMSGNQKMLDKIYYDVYDGIFEDRHAVKFTYTNAESSSAALISAIVGKDIVASFQYTKASTKEANSAHYKHFLTSVFVNGLKQLDLSYNGLAVNSTGNSSISLPDSLSKEIDQWGYYNGSGATSLLPAVYINSSNPSIERYRTQSPGSNSGNYTYFIPGTDRSVNTNTIANGSLKSVSYYYGGSTSFVYEPNDYLDYTAGAVIMGGGIRVKQVIQFDGVNSDNNTISNYSYLNPATGQSSGKAISLPLLAFTRVYNGGGSLEQIWQKSTARLEESVSPESNVINYSFVKVSKNRAGSTLFEYSAPATYWDSSYGEDWFPTFVNYSAFSCASSGMISRSTNTYPFVNNPNYDFERGLLKRMAQYNDNGNKVAESIYSYSRINPAITIPALKYEYIDAVGTYAKYPIYSGTNNVISSVKNIEYIAPSYTDSWQNTTTSYYESANHRLLTKQETTSSDGSIKQQYIKYSKDYTATSDQADPTNVALNGMISLNVNLPVENYLQVKKSGVTKTISANLLKYRSINNGYTPIYVPSQKLAFVNSDGVDNFNISNIGANVFNNDSRYKVIENDLIYDGNGRLLTYDDNNKNVNTILTDYRTALPVALISNARADEIGYDDFETEGSYSSFTYNHNKRDLTSNRSGKYSLTVNASDVFSRTLLKSNTSKNAVFSIWIKSAVAGNFTVSLVNSSGAVYPFNFSYAKTSDAFQYYEIKVPLANMSPTFTVNCQASTALSIDDMLFYPENANVNTIGYDPDTYLKTAETNTNGIAKYYTYDRYRRLRYVLDQDKNILLKKSYINDADVIDQTANISISGNLKSGEVLRFTSSSTINDGVTYQWNFGDGTAQVTTTDLQTNHTYLLPGKYTVTVTKNSPFFGSVTGTTTVEITANVVKLYATYPGGTNGTITSVDFYQGNTRVYSFTGADIMAGGKSILAGDYTVRVSVTGNIYSASNTGGYRRMFLHRNTGAEYCLSAMTGKAPIYIMGISLYGQTSLQVGLDLFQCTGSGGGIE